MARQEGPRGFEMEDPAPGGQGRSAAEGQTFTFASLVLSLSTSALMHMGAAPRDEGEEEAPGGEVNLPAARQVIEILEMLSVKTQGNLDADETRMIEQVLHDLHLRFVEQKKKS